MPNVWETQLILKVQAGSRAYGLDGPDSDHDSRGICMPPRQALLGLASFEQHQSEGGDHVVFGLPKFVRLASEGNPNLVETLYTEDLLFCNRFGERLRVERDLFLSRQVADRFGHYALQQLKRLKNHYRWWAQPPQEPSPAAFGARPGAEGRPKFADAASRLAFDTAQKEWTNFQRWQRERNPLRAQLEQRHGYDTKHAMHLCRLLRMAQEILTDRRVLVRRPDREWLLAVRQGAWSYDELLSWATEAEARVRCEGRDVGPIAGDEVVDAHDGVVAVEERLAQV